MNNVATLAAAAIQQAQAQPEALQVAPVIRKLFILLHGSYGNLFISKFSTGEKDAQGRDKGIRAAMKVWESKLAQYPADVVETAAGRMTAAHAEYPPNLPQFEVLCLAAMPRPVYRPATPALPMSGALRSQYAAQARAITERHAKKQAEKRLGADFESVPGLAGLKQAIANAVANAGGDEVRELRRLDLLLAPKVVA